MPSSPSHELIVSPEDRCGLRSSKRFSRYGFRTAQHHRATDFFLLRADETGFRFSIVMTDLAERLEVGVLNVEAVKEDYAPQVERDLPEELAEQQLHVERLVLSTEYGDVDSGLVLTSPHRGEIVIVAGAYPYTIEVSAEPRIETPYGFEPEYAVDRYRRAPLSV